MNLHRPGTSQVFDKGLQPERTALAWRRTALALVIAATVGMRILPETLGLWAAVPASAGLLAAVGVYFAAHLRYRHVHRTLISSTGDRIPLTSGTLLALVAGLTSTAGICILLLVVFGDRPLLAL